MTDERMAELRKHLDCSALFVRKQCIECLDEIAWLQNEFARLGKIEDSAKRLKAANHASADWDTALAEIMESV